MTRSEFDRVIDAMEKRIDRILEPERRTVYFALFQSEEFGAFLEAAGLVSELWEIFPLPAYFAEAMKEKYEPSDLI